MKKIYLLILLVATICFAGNVSVGITGCSDVSDGFYFFNNGDKDVNGFKFYYYFNHAPVENVNDIHVDIFRMTGKTSSGYDKTILPKKIGKPKRLSATQSVVVFDYSNAVIPAHGRFPIPNRPLTAYLGMKIDIDGENTDWARSKESKLRAFVVESLSGEVLDSRKVTYNSEKKLYEIVKGNSHPTIDNFRRVGVLTNESSCGFERDNKNNLVHTITLGTEKDVAGTKIVQGNSSPLGITISKNNRQITFRYCTVYADRLPGTPYAYAVLKLDSECPVGSIPVTRIHDTENTGNPNSSSQYIWPNAVKTDARLEYCFASGKRGSTLKYPFTNEKYGVFSYFNNSSNPIAYTRINVEDEHDNNANSWDWSAVPLHLESNFWDIMNGYYGKTYTTYNVIKWIGGPLSKSAAEIADAPISAEKTLVAAVPHAPAIKGLSRSAVSVELKSEGKVKVSIVNANGSVIANIAQENLQPGVHQIKWNSGMVSSGRYIVKVEQNGMVNAKNVVLK